MKLLITTFIAWLSIYTVSFTTEIKVFNFTETELSQLEVRKVRSADNRTVYTVGSNENGNFLGSVSGGCVESNVISECLELIKKDNSFKKIDLKVADKNAWNVGLACGGEISIYIELINL